MTTDELRDLPVGTRLTYVYGMGIMEERHPARLVERGSYYTGILIRFTSKPQAKVRWSHATNRPVGTRAHLGAVRLER